MLVLFLARFALMAFFTLAEMALLAARTQAPRGAENGARNGPCCRLLPQSGFRGQAPRSITLSTLSCRIPN